MGKAKSRAPTMAAQTNEQATIAIKPIKRAVATFRIIGDTELITHPFGEKERRKMLWKQMGLPQNETPKNPIEDYNNSFYRDDEGRACLPAMAFKCAIVDAARLMDDVKMTELKQAVSILAELIPIEGTPRMREDMARTSTGVATFSFRPGFRKWRCEIPVAWVSTMIGESAMVALVNAAGVGGVGDWRPSSPKVKSGWAGTFHVATQDEWDEWEDSDGANPVYDKYMAVAAEAEQLRDNATVAKAAKKSAAGKKAKA